MAVVCQDSVSPPEEEEVSTTDSVRHLLFQLLLVCVCPYYFVFKLNQKPIYLQSKLHTRREHVTAVVMAADRREDKGEARAGYIADRS